MIVGKDHKTQYVFREHKIKSGVGFSVIKRNESLTVTGYTVSPKRYGEYMTEFDKTWKTLLFKNSEQMSLCGDPVVFGVRTGHTDPVLTGVCLEEQKPASRKALALWLRKISKHL